MCGLCGSRCATCAYTCGTCGTNFPGGAVVAGAINIGVLKSPLKRSTVMTASPGLSAARSIHSTRPKCAGWGCAAYVRPGCAAISRKLHQPVVVSDDILVFFEGEMLGGIEGRAPELSFTTGPPEDCCLLLSFSVRSGRSASRRGAVPLALEHVPARVQNLRIRMAKTAEAGIPVKAIRRIGNAAAGQVARAAAECHARVRQRGRRS